MSDDSFFKVSNILLAVLISIAVVMILSLVLMGGCFIKERSDRIDRLEIRVDSLSNIIYD